MNNETVEIKIVEHNKKLDEHKNKISNLEKSDARQDSEIDNLCEKIDKLVDVNNKWFYLAVTTMLEILVKLVFFKCDAFTNGNVEVTFDGSINIKFNSVIGIHPNLDNLKNSLEEIKPAYLAINIYLSIY